MGAGTSAEEFFLKSINVESIFEFVERTDYLFLYSIKECVEKSDCHEGVYLSEVAEYMKLSIPETSKMVKSLENKGYIIWKLDEKKKKNIESKYRISQPLALCFDKDTLFRQKASLFLNAVRPDIESNARVLGKVVINDRRERTLKSQSHLDFH